MNRFAVLGYLLVLSSAGFVQADCPPRTTDPSAKIIDALSDDRAKDALENAEQWLEDHPGDYCTRYFTARYYTRKGDFSRANLYLSQVSAETAGRADLEISPQNILGFIALSEANNDQALDSFSKALTSASYSNFPNELKQKVLNNLGYTYMQLGRWEDAKRELKKAAELGSTKAIRNLAAVTSTVSSLEAKDTNGGGAFAAIIGSSRRKQIAKDTLGQLANQLNVDAGALSVFQMNNGKYAISIGQYNSYPRALSDLETAQQAGIDDAYVGWLVDWTAVNL